MGDFVGRGLPQGLPHVLHFVEAQFSDSKAYDPKQCEKLTQKHPKTKQMKKH